MKVYNPAIQQALNHTLDLVVSPYVRFGQKALSKYQLLGVLGFLLGTAWGAWLVTRQGLSAWLFVGLAVIGVLTFLGLTLIIKMVTAEEKLSNYHNQVAAILAVAIVLALLDGPNLPYLDAFAVGLGIFIACGRLGCLMAGCCHGCPHEWGVCYGADHAADGFTTYLVGVRLFPTQLIESVVTWGIIGVCTNLLLAGFVPGSALAWYGAAYSALRFVLEFWRADNQRPFWWNISETHWLSTLITLAIAGLEWAGVLPLFGIHVILSTALLGWLLFLVYRRRWAPGAQPHILYPPHLHEVARILDSDLELSQGPQVHLATTSLGIQISTSCLEEGGQMVQHYAFSRPYPALTADRAQILADLILKLKHRQGSPELIQSREGVFHLLVRPGRSGG